MEPLLNFLAVAAVAMLVPGPDTFVVLRTTLADGRSAGTWAAAGSATGNVAWGAASAVGVTGLAASDTAFAALKLVGAAYLVFVGLQALLAAARNEPLAREDGDQDPASATVAFRRGLVSDLLNAKVGLFWTALVPQFLTSDASPLLPLAMLAVMGSLVFLWLAAYAQLAGRLSTTLKRRRSARAVNGTVGAVFLGLGARLATARH